MKPVRVSDGWAAAGSVAELQAAVKDYLHFQGMRVTGEQPGEIHARRATTVLGFVLGPLAPLRWLPHRAVVKLQSREAGVGVRAEVEADTDSAGPRWNAAYQVLFARWMSGLRDTLPSADRDTPPTA